MGSTISKLCLLYPSRATLSEAKKQRRRVGQAEEEEEEEEAGERVKG